MPELEFDNKFYWGAATAAYQIEGSPLADGSGRCIWHEFSHTPGTTYLGHNGDVAADHYHKWPEDVALMKSLNLNAYRFSLRWPRVLPEGKGAVNQAGIDFYDRLVDGLLAAGIEPFVTLYHWDLPAALARQGGWSNPDIAGWFGDYATVVAGALSDRVKFWITLNEPFVVTAEGYLVGNHAPGMRNIYHAGHSVHHQIRAHVAGAQALKALSPQASVGLAAHNTAVWPASEAEEDMAAAERAEAWHNFPLFLDPLVLGHYPQAIEDRLAPYLPEGYESELSALVHPPDFIGLNYYHGYYARHADDNWLGFVGVDEPDAPRTTMNWIIRPEGLHRVITQAHERYKLPAVYVTENGASFDDTRQGDVVHDEHRTAYLKSHVAAVLQAKDEGIPVRGYFVWSLMDNFEWALGYSKRFGIVYVDYETQERVVKDSGHWYAELARSGVPPEG
ncbi:MAG TPA: GH1 family beta-glucosidase [Acidimicrobiales bacterium]|nr:GH1 family beta-glucosidase [Acidimicrobiales bacterium]